MRAFFKGLGIILLVGFGLVILAIGGYLYSEKKDSEKRREEENRIKIRVTGKCPEESSKIGVKIENSYHKTLNELSFRLVA
jgi:hypothetical protein